jgi:hypothetical protein
MRRLKLWLGIAGLIALLTAGVAVAKHRHGGTHTDPVMTAFTVTQSSMRDRTCTGSDGMYREFKATYRGTSTGGDPRLAGNVVIRSHGLINQTSGFGSSHGTLYLRSDSGRSIARARYFAVNTNLGVLHGFITGWVRDRVEGGVEEQDGSGKLMANFKATFNATGTVLTGQLGGTAADPRTPAVIQQGGCDNRGKGHRKR